MPPGEVDKPRSDDNALKTGYLVRFDLLDDDGNPSRIPALNAQGLNKGLAVVFDVIPFDINYKGNAYSIPVGVIRDELLMNLEQIEEEETINQDVRDYVDWDLLWKNKVNPKIKIKNLQKILAGKKTKVERDKNKSLLL